MCSEPVGRSGVGFARTQCANGARNKIRTYAAGPSNQKGGRIERAWGLVGLNSQRLGLKTVAGEEKKTLFLCTECSLLALSSAGTDLCRCRDRIAARLHLRFFSTAGARRNLANCKIRCLGTKTIDITYQSFLCAPVALGDAELATLKELVLAAMPRLTSGLEPLLKTTKP